jgi:NAD(P)H-dependent flavin oxidoreductase YrpB (nitropropane dioxygenase family)
VTAIALPAVIQGGMGIGISGWRLARAVSLRGQLGVVFGTAIDSLFVRRLQDGDPGGHLRRVITHFPFPEAAASALRRYFRVAGGAAGAPYRMLPMYRKGANRSREQLTMLASFAEVWLAKEGHGGLAGLNLLTKLQLPNLAALYGAMLAGVDYVLMGAGIPREIPAVLDAFAAQEPATIRLEIEGAQKGMDARILLDPRDHWRATPPPLSRPRVLPIIASNSLAAMLARKAGSGIDGFVVEGWKAGGHNAPPRGALQLNDRGEPVYGERDEVDLAKVRELGLPFWLAGGTGSPEALRTAQAAGAAGIQVGTLFADAPSRALPPTTRIPYSRRRRRARWTCSPTRSPRRPGIHSRRCAGRAIRSSTASSVSACATWDTCACRTPVPTGALAIAAPRRRWPPTWTRVGERRTPLVDAACVTHSWPTRAMRRSARMRGGSRRCSRAATT